MLKYSKFVNFNTGRDRKATVGVLETNMMPRHEAISSTYVEVFLPESDAMKVPSSLEEFLAPCESDYQNDYANHQVAYEEIVPVVEPATLEQLFAFTVAMSSSVEVEPQEEQAPVDGMYASALTLEELFADTEDCGPVSLQDIFSEMVNEQAGACLHRW